MGVRKIKPRKLILIAAEGNKTEANYFKQFNNMQDEYHINFTKSNYTDPQQMTNALF